MLRRRMWAVLIAVALLAAACGGGSENGSNSSNETSASADSFATPFGDAEVYPVFISSDVAVGENRFLIGLLDSNDAPVGTPEINVKVDFFDLEESDHDPAFKRKMDFVWSVPSERGVYVTEASFGRAGEWGAEVTIRGGGFDETVRGSFSVLEESVTPAIGAPAPATDNATRADVSDLSKISTDSNPDPSFYESTIKDALETGQPIVVAFATPKFCTSAVCGPTLDIVKDASSGFPDVTFIHVEVYTNLDDPSNLQLVPAVEEWKLPSEPWVFVVDSAGNIAAKFEGVVGEEELRETLKSL